MAPFRPLSLLAAVFGAMALAATGPAAAQDAAPALVKVDVVRLEPLSQTVPVLGRLVPRRAGVVATTIDGPVEEVVVEVGDRVAAGDVLAVLNTDRLDAERALRAAELAESQARLATAQAQLTIARQVLQRLEAMRQSAAFQQARYDDQRVEVTRAESQVAEAAAAIERAEANLEMAAIDLRRTAVRAPYAGVVTQRHIEAGAYASSGDAVVTLISDADLEIEADVPAQRLGGLAPGTQVAVELDDGTRHNARVRAIVPAENPLTRTQAVRFAPDFAAAGRRLAANQSVTLHIPVGEQREVVTVHKDAVITRQGRAVVFVVDGGTAEDRTVVLGEAVGGRLEVRQGLRPGELVVVRGNERLRTGQSVTIDEAPAPAAGDAG